MCAGGWGGVAVGFCWGLLLPVDVAWLAGELDDRCGLAGVGSEDPPGGEIGVRVFCPDAEAGVRPVREVLGWFDGEPAGVGFGECEELVHLAGASCRGDERVVAISPLGDKGEPVPGCCVGLHGVVLVTDLEAPVWFTERIDPELVIRVLAECQVEQWPVTLLAGSDGDDPRYGLETYVAL